jgi:Zn-dependent protease with chaperone function
MPPLAALGRPRPAAPRIALFGATLAVAVGSVLARDRRRQRYARALCALRPAGKLGESVAERADRPSSRSARAAGLAAINGLANRWPRRRLSRIPSTVTSSKGGPVNAFTLPGGILVFYSDLIDRARNGNEVAGVLAHEMGHVVHYHAIQGLARQFGIDQLLKAMTGGFSDLGTVGQGGTLLLALRNGRGFERDADATGVGLLEKLGLRADGVASFFERMLENQPGDMAAAIGIWSSHPPTRERIEATRRPATGKPAFSDAEWAALRAACSR